MRNEGLNIVYRNGRRYRMSSNNGSGNGGRLLVSLAALLLESPCLHG